MVKDLLRAVDQLSEPALRGVVLRCVLLAIGLFGVLMVVAWLLLGLLVVTGWPWLDATLQWAGAGLILLPAWFLFPATVIGMAGLFLDRVADAVEHRYYPGLPPVREPGLLAAVAGSLKLALLAFCLNLLFLPVYFLPGANLILFLGLNGYLLGREYFELVAHRRHTARTAAVLRQRHRGYVFLAGIVIAGMLAVPFLNLIAPVLAAAFMVHRYRRLPDHNEDIAQNTIYAANKSPIGYKP
ncbi:EI24 domain-containing protein [Marinivivus vitaminiproducens]|uniref:EI24 domain-containing protein n=1 Tax=Marinivivus vitaminiproducens TaxID=3035935 RepID=UPI0027A1D223|nr:EI24 domain-containing protein [Geminicoccaceae bacterium SCSIO 64248]